MAPALATAPADDPELASCKSKLKQFRIKELKDVLHQLGLPRQGKKQELLDRLTTVLCYQKDQHTNMSSLQDKSIIGRERLVKVVEETFRKMQDPTNTVAASRSHVDSGDGAKPKMKPDDSPKLDAICFCPCGNSIPNDSMIKCTGPQCDVWQHVSCVIIPEKPADNSAPELPSSFCCEMCRINRADPFWVTVDDPLLSVLIAPSIIAADGSYTGQYTAKSFTLSRAYKEMLQKAEYDLQAWCILLNDKVPFRMHWPLHSNMHVNGVHVRVVNRQPTQQLGANGRDDGPVITDYVREGSNKIALSGNDSRTFCLGIRIVKRRTLEQVLNLVPKEQDGEKFDDALNRVRRCVGGGTEANNADSDSDIEVVADSVSVNIRCPMTASRIRVAGRFKPCAHMGCFDLEAFIEINQRSRKWQCPICLKNYSLENIIIDPYFNRITTLIQSCGADTSEIDVKPDGSWRAKGGPELKELAQWHSPDGTLAMTTYLGATPTPNTGAVKHEPKEEPLYEEPGCRLKLGLRKNRNGQWQIRKKDFGSNKNCTTTGDEGNKDGSCILESGKDNCPVSHVHDLESSPAPENVPPSPREQDMIVLSDSDDDVTVLSPKAGSVPNPLEASGVQPGGGPNETTYLALKECFGDLGLSFWDVPLSPRDDPSIPGEVRNQPAKDQSNHEPASADDESLVIAETAVPQKRRNSEGGRTGLNDSALGSTDDDCPLSSREKRRSVRPRVVLTVDSDTD